MISLQLVTYYMFTLYTHTHTHICILKCALLNMRLMSSFSKCNVREKKKKKKNLRTHYKYTSSRQLTYVTENLSYITRKLTNLAQ